MLGGEEEAARGARNSIAFAAEHLQSKPTIEAGGRGGVSRFCIASLYCTVTRNGLVLFFL